jgi:hypothetical protein
VVSYPIIRVQLNSDKISFALALGSLLRFVPTVVAACPSVLMRVLGLGGSSSRMIRRSSSKPTPFKRSWSNGVVPVSSS